MEKVFVKVRCSHLPDGTIRPESLEWEDGQVWEITRTIHVAAPADHEFEGIFVSLWGRSCWTPFSGRTKKAAGAASRLLMRSHIP